ncbi:TPA: hypothetical protein ACH3X1_012300 [Trebouxia sp. C0004]
MTNKRKGHRREDDCWDYFTKIKLSEDQIAKLHRNHNARCKSCGATVAGQPAEMKIHMTKQCSHISHTGRLHAFASQASVGNSAASTSADQSRKTVKILWTLMSTKLQ